MALVAGPLTRIVMRNKTIDYLPLSIAGEKVYAGFWRRLGAALIDMLVWVPIAYIVFTLQGTNLTIAIAATVAHGFFFSIYSVFFNLVYGGTLGKLAVGIRITKPNGGRIGLREALLRSSVDIFYGLLFSYFYVHAILEVDLTAYLAAGYMEKSEMIYPLFPRLSVYTNTLTNIWYWSEMVVLLLNKRRRALHDYVAGTVVVHKEHMHNNSIEADGIQARSEF